MDIDHQQLRDGTDLISNFMGSTISINVEGEKDIPLAFLKPEDMKFHESWKWLMPVVVKMEEELEYPVTITGNHCKIEAGDEVFETEADSKIEAIWKTVVACLDAE